MADTSCRHFSISHNSLSVPQEQCAALAWPHDTRYAIWAYNVTNSTFRAYVEFRQSQRPSSLRDIPSEDLKFDHEITREARRDTVRNLTGAQVWEFGDWAAGRSGRRPAAPAVIGGASVQTQLTEMQHMVEEQQRQINELKERPQNLTQNNTVNMNITINNFGSEDVSYIDVDTLAQRCLTRMNGIIATIQDTHLNADHPENQNVKLVSRRRNIMAVMEGGQWKHEPTSVVIDKLIWNGHVVNMRCHRQKPVDDMTDVELDDATDFNDWCVDVTAVKQNKNIQKGHIRTGRQRVRTMLLQHPKPASDP